MIFIFTTNFYLRKNRRFVTISIFSGTLYITTLCSCVFCQLNYSVKYVIQNFVFFNNNLLHAMLFLLSSYAGINKFLSHWGFVNIHYQACWCERRCYTLKRRSRILYTISSELLKVILTATSVCTLHPTSANKQNL